VAFPDVEKLVASALDTALTGVHVCTVLPVGDDFHTQLPIVRVVRRGGTPVVRRYLDGPLVDVDVWHTDLAALSTLVESARDALDDLYGQSTADGIVTAVAENVGPQRLPEDDPAVIRAGFTITLITRRLAS
jgi:hypothetical protein